MTHSCPTRRSSDRKPELRISGRSARAVAVVDLLERAPPEGIHQMDRLAIKLAIATERGEPADPGHILLRGADRIDFFSDADLAEDLDRKSTRLNSSH